MNRTITVNVLKEFARQDSQNGGIQGSGNVDHLRLRFSEDWDGYAKTCVFWDANGENPVKVIVGADKLEDVTKDPRTYIIDIPPEPLAVEGAYTVVIDGYLDGKRGRSETIRLKSNGAQIADDAGEPADPTPSQAEQLQQEIEKIIPNIQSVATEAKSWAVGGTGSRDGEDTDNAKYYAQQSEKSAHESAQGLENISQQVDVAKSYAESAKTESLHAANHAQNAVESERNAAASESAAAGSAAEAKKSEQAAAGSASSASISAGSASSSASAAAGSASTAAQKAGEAASSASEASTAASNAKDSETEAKTSETNAKASETAAKNHMDAAQTAQQAIENMTVSVKTLAPGSAATATKTTASGVVNIEYGIPRGEQGQGLTIYGYYSTIGELEEAVPSPKEGAAYGVGVIEPYDIYVWDAIHSTWKNNGPIQGPAGPQGENGSDGKAATVRVGTVTTGEPGSQAAVSNGGTESDAVFNFTIPRGADGRDGAEGPAGADGKSAYQSAKEQGYTGTEAEFYAALVSLKDGPFLPLSGGDVLGININGSLTTDGDITVDLKGCRVQGVESPIDGTDAANKNYVDGLVGDINALLDTINGEAV